MKNPVMSGKGRHDVSYVLRICGVAALGGILFGYDTAVIAGVIGPIQEYFHLSPAQTGWAVSNVVIGSIIGAAISGWMAQKLGRRSTLLICALLFTVQSVGAAVATDFFWFIAYRMLGGIAVGVASTVSPMYMSEVSPKDMRGRAIIMEQFAIVAGQTIVFVVNFLIAMGGSTLWLRDMGWRWMVASEIVPCVIFCCTIFLIPESPRWHMLKGREDKAFKTLTRISNEQHARSLINEIRSSLLDENDTGLSLLKILADRRARWIVFAGLMVCSFQQLTGINAMMFYAPMILISTSGSVHAALFQTIWIGVAQIVGCLIGSWCVDRYGRKVLIRYGSTGMIASLIFVSAMLYFQIGGVLPLLGMVAFMTFFGLSWGPVAWILVSEIFPNRLRSAGMSIAISVSWCMVFLVAQFFPMIAENTWLKDLFHGAFSMWIFVALSLVGTWFVLRFIPETKGVSLEKIEEIMCSYEGSAHVEPLRSVERKVS